MIKWKPWEGTADDWDKRLQQFADYSVHQCYEWGEHKGRFGWLPVRLEAISEGKTIAMEQALLKRYPLKIGIAWVPGGPIGDLNAWNDNLWRVIRKTGGVNFLVCRINSYRTCSDQEENQLINQGWRRAATTLLSGLSLIYQPSLSEDERQKLCSSNWRHNLRRSGKYGLRSYIWNDPDPEQMINVYSIMEDYKQLAEQTSRAEIESLLSTFRRNCILVRCDDTEGHMLAFRGALLVGNKGRDIFAATTPQGRKVYASHLAFWKLIEQCATRGILSYDMGGADPINNRGVYDFKKGTGAKDIRYLGEWVYARPAILSLVTDRLLALKGR